MLVGGLEHEFIVPCIGNIIIPIDFHIFSEGLKPPTSESIHVKCTILQMCCDYARK